MMKKLILFLSVTLFSLNVIFANSEFANTEFFVAQFNAVKVEVPATIRCKYAESYSIEINGRQDYLYRTSMVGDTLVISPYFKNSKVDEMKPEDVVIVLKHPQPQRIINELEINKNSLKKIKSGNLKK